MDNQFTSFKYFKYSMKQKQPETDKESHVL